MCSSDLKLQPAAGRAGASEISGWQANPPSETRRREAYGKLRRVRKAVEELPRKVSNESICDPYRKWTHMGEERILR